MDGTLPLEYLDRPRDSRPPLAKALVEANAAHLAVTHQAA